FMLCLPPLSTLFPYTTLFRSLFSRSIIMSVARMHLPDYIRIKELLARARSLADAAEAHGTLAGCLCGAAGYGFEDWLREILPEGRAEAAAVASLRELYTGTAQALLEPDMEFELLLPGDEESIDART